MEMLSKSHLQSLISNHQNKGGSNVKDPHISLYIPKEVIDEVLSENKKSWHSIMGKVESFVSSRYPGAETKISLFYKKIKEAVKERKNLGGVAIFESRFVSGFIPLGGKVRELAIVSDSFHVKPLLNEIQGQNRFYVLTLEGDSAILWEGDSSSLEKKAYFSMPHNRKIPEIDQQMQSTQGQQRHRKGFQHQAVRQLMHFYKELGKRLKRQVAHYSDPVYIVGEPSLRSVFMNVNKAKNLLTHTRLDVEPKKFDQETLFQTVWSIASQDTYRKIKRFAKDYRLYKFGGRGVESLPEIARAALDGSIEALLVTKDHHLWGEIDRKSGKISYAPVAQTDLKEDLLDDIAEAVISQGGKVYVLERKDMPQNLDVWAVLKRKSQFYS